MPSSPKAIAVLAIICASQAVRAEPKLVSFRNDVMAAISKAGCNLGTCHGNATGKGGFKLSLRGQDIDFDYNAFVLDAAGRRVNPFTPDNSLMLLKGSNKLAHEGGKRFDPQSWEYQTLRSWIAQGMPSPSGRDAQLKKLEVTPRDDTLEESTNSVQLKVVATFSDGSTRDVSMCSVYEPLQVGMVNVSHDGLVQRQQFGEATVLVRFLSQAVPVRLAFVRKPAGFVWSQPRSSNYIDVEVFSKLRDLHIQPSGMCDDRTFARRAWFDLLGIPPTADEAKAFLVATDPNKRARLIDTLLARPEFVDFWTMKWADVLKVESRTLDTIGMNAFHAWIRDAVRTNRPVDEFVRDIIAARGSTYQVAPANYYRANRTPVERGVTAAQVFLGTRLQCAQCHNHPFDKWTQDDYYNWAAVFARVDYKLISDKRTDKSDKHEFIGEQVVMMKSKADFENPRTGELAMAKFLGGSKAGATEKGFDELDAAAAWLTGKENPLFAKAQANRIWYHLMGRGLVDPVDDMRITNPASHPVLLDKLTQDFVRSGFDMRHLIRTIMLSRTYQLESTPNDSNKHDTINYSHVAPRRLGAEQLFDALHQALGVVADLEGLPRGTRACQKPGPINGKSARKLDPESPDAFLSQFGKPARQLSCECERTTDTSLSTTFQLISGPLMTQLITSRQNVLSALVGGDVSTALEMLYWRTLGRAPSDAERSGMMALLSRAGEPRRRQAWEDIAWSLVNAKEFVLRP